MLSGRPENRLLHPSKTQKSIFAIGDAIYLKQASHVSPQISVTQHLETSLGQHREECDQHPQVHEQGAALLQIEVPKPAGICSAAG